MTLPEVKADPRLEGMELMTYGRLSVQSVTRAHFTRVRKLGGGK